MLTSIVSDLHLSTIAGTDIARHPDATARLADALAGSDRVVFLGDLLELRDRPVTEALELAAPVLSAIGEALGDAEVVIVPGNHDHELVSPALERARFNGGGPLPTEATYAPVSGELSGRVASLLSGCEVVLAYPGLHLRPDVYATHGHYLDLHLTIPRAECVIASAIARSFGDDAAAGPDAYERALTPLYALSYSLVQFKAGAGLAGGGRLARQVYASARPDSGMRPSLAGLAIGRLAIPAGVAAANALGFGPFRSDISAVELRRSGLRAMAAVVDDLGIAAEHVIFGHTHRAGPLPGEVEGWWMPGGRRLTNSGSWLHETPFLSSSGPENPYWPGRVVRVRDEGPPQLENALGDLDPAALRTEGRSL